jgi:hypothetical protein
MKRTLLHGITHYLSRLFMIIVGLCSSLNTNYHEKSTEFCFPFGGPNFNPTIYLITYISRFILEDLL